MKCLNCQVETTNPKFCSRSCSASYNNKIYIKRKPEHFCMVCRTPINNLNKFCSLYCKNKYKETKNKKLTNSERVSRYRRNAKLKMIEYKGGKCEVCGYNKCIAALDFHHIDPLEKDFALGSKISSWDIVVKELDKCIMVCSNCHREIHNKSLFV